MYSDKIKAIKYQPKEEIRIAVWQSKEFTRERMKQIVSEFCTKDDINYAEQTKLLDLFDAYCKENGYPLFNRKTIGAILERCLAFVLAPLELTEKLNGFTFANESDLVDGLPL